MLCFILRKGMDERCKRSMNPLEELLQNCVGYPTSDPFHVSSLRLHEVVENPNENAFVLQGCYWLHQQHVPKEILQTLQPQPKLSSLAPKSAQKSLKLWYKHPSQSDYVGLPKFYGLSAFGFPKKDLRVDGLSIETTWNDQFQLKPMQQQGISQTLKMLDNWGGAFFIADCGFGKSVVIARLIHEIKKKCVVVVPRLTLLHQMVNDLGGKESQRQSVLINQKVGVLQGSWESTKKNVEEQDIIVASLDSLASFHYPQEFWKDIGLVIFDEAHHMAAQTLSACLPHIPAKRIVGFSATPNRKDGLEHVLYWLLGPACFMYQRLPSVTGLKHTVKIIKKEGIPVQDIFTWGGKLSFTEMVTFLVKDEKRNQFIIDSVKEIMKDRKKILLISAIREHCEILTELLYKETDKKIQVIHGGVKKRKLDYIPDILVATYGMLEEGFDDADLDTLVLCTPRSTVQQTIGRIERVKENKLVPLVIDIVDQHAIFQGMWWKRFHFYKSRGFAIEQKDAEIKQEIDFGYIEDESD